MNIICIPGTETSISDAEMVLLERAEKMPIVYDEDCPELSDEELLRFRPVCAHDGRRVVETV